MCAWWSVSDLRGKSSNPFLPSCQTFRIGTFCQSKLKGPGAEGPGTGVSLPNSSLLLQPGQVRALHPGKKQIRGNWGGRHTVKAPREEMVASGNFRGNRQTNPFFHTSAPLLLPAIEEETLEKGEPVGLSRPWRLDSAPFRPCQGGLEGGATWREPQLPGKMAARFRWDS